MAQRTLWKDKVSNFRIAEEDDAQHGTILWIADDLEETELSFTREELKEMLPIINAWFKYRHTNRTARKDGRIVDKLTKEQRLYNALKRITMYDMPDKLRKRAERDYGLEPHEVIEMAYENVLMEAAAAIKGMKAPK
jgi:hypothetical protein